MKTVIILAALFSMQVYAQGIDPNPRHYGSSDDESAFITYNAHGRQVTVIRSGIEDLQKKLAQDLAHSKQHNSSREILGSYHLELYGFSGESAVTDAEFAMDALARIQGEELRVKSTQEGAGTPASSALEEYPRGKTSSNSK